MKTVVGMFDDVDGAQHTFEELTRLGFSPNDISIVTESSERTAIGGMKLNAFDAGDARRLRVGGPLGTMLGQRRADLVGSLRSAGISHAEAEHYAAAIRRGETLESVLVEDRDAARVVEIMRRHAARDNVGAPPASAGRATGAASKGASKTGTTSEDRYIPVMREELHVGKREVERGVVRVDVRVREQPVSEHIKLREEHIEIERRPADRAPRPDEALFRGGQLDFTERGEEAVVSKQVRVVEEIRIHKTMTEREEVISDKVRSTDVDIDELAGERRAYRAHFDALGSKGSFEEDLPAYELGRSLRGSTSERWEDVETNARQRWEAKRPGTWEKYKDGIRYAWSRAR